MIRSSKHLLVVAVVLIAGSVAPMSPGAGFSLVGLSEANQSLSQLRENSTGSDFIGVIQPSIGSDAAVLASAGDGLVYVINRETDELFTVRVATATVIASVTLDADVAEHERGLDTSADGELFGVFAGPQLRTIDPTTGTTTLVGDIDLGRVEGLAFADDGTLYAIGTFSTTDGSDRLYTLDPTTGLSTFVSVLATPDIDCLTFAPDGYLYGADSTNCIDDLLRIDPATGDLENLGTTGISQLNGLVARIEPAAVTVDIIPSSCPNTINTDARGVLWVTVAGNDEVSVADIDLATIRLIRTDGPGGEVTPLQNGRGGGRAPMDTIDGSAQSSCSCPASSPDGHDDLRLRFRTSDVVDMLLPPGASNGTLVNLSVVGRMLDGTPIAGHDCVIVMNHGRRLP